MADFEVLHALRIKGMASAESLAAATAADAEEVDGALAALQAEGLVERTPDADPPAWMLTPAGLEAHEERIAKRREETGGGGVAAAYDSFLELNDPAKRLVSRSQQAGVDQREILFELEEIAERVREALDYAARHERRFGAYGRRFDLALEGVGAGDSRYVDDPAIDSFHTVWFECHEDFLLTLGLSREE